MERGKSQVVYKFLPEMWVSERTDDNAAVTARIKNWNTAKMFGIYDSFIENEIKRQIAFFGKRGGDISSYNLSKPHSLSIQEVAMRPGIPDIVAEISPLVFYCSACGNAFKLNNSSQVTKDVWRCKACGKWAVKQLQMIYACECGQVMPIKIPFVPGVKDFKYKPVETPFKMFYKDNGVEKPAEFSEQCPTCGKRLVPDAASSGRNYKPFTLSVINLVDDRSGKFYEKGIDAQKTVIAKWFEKIDAADYEYILNNVDLAFSDEFRNDSLRKDAEEKVRNLIAAGILPEVMFETAVNNMLGTASNKRSVETYVNECDKLFSTKKAAGSVLYDEWVNYYSFKLMQYYTIRYAQRTITLEESVEKQIELEFIDGPEEIYDLNKKLGISNMQVSCDVQIINCTYGYTRRSADPQKSGSTAHALKLNAFAKTRDGEANDVYSSKLDTEGLLFEIDQKKIIEWLYINGIISEEKLPDMDDALSVKQWYAENVRGDLISTFGEIPDTITMYVFALLHSMSHAFISAAGELSGLASNSLTELIFVETASIFLYSQTNQEITLGALSGMAETNYAHFLKKVFENSRNCVFDPICSERDHTACSACILLPEVSCKHFNAQLGRKYLYSFSSEKDITKGFWEM